MNRRSVIIADDEPNAREYLTRLIENTQRFELLGVYKNGGEVIQFCKTHVPDIILLDIEMPGTNGIDTARKLMEINEDCLIIFITAYDQYAIAAFDLMAIGYLLKPFSKEDFLKVLTHAEKTIESREKINFSERIERLWEHYNTPKHTRLEKIDIKEKGLVKTVEVSDILFIKSDSEYVQLITRNGTHLLRMSLKIIADQLPHNFRQIHRSYVINKEKIDNWKYLNNGTFQFDLGSGHVIKSSRSYHDTIRRWLNN